MPIGYEMITGIPNPRKYDVHIITNYMLSKKLHSIVRQNRFERCKPEIIFENPLEKKFNYTSCKYKGFGNKDSKSNFKKKRSFDNSENIKEINEKKRFGILLDDIHNINKKKYSSIKFYKKRQTVNNPISSAEDSQKIIIKYDDASDEDLICDISVYKNLTTANL